MIRNQRPGRWFIHRIVVVWKQIPQVKSLDDRCFLDPSWNGCCHERSQPCCMHIAWTSMNPDTTIDHQRLNDHYRPSILCHFSLATYWSSLVMNIFYRIIGQKPPISIIDHHCLHWPWPRRTQVSSQSWIWATAPRCSWSKVKSWRLSRKEATTFCEGGFGCQDCSRIKHES